MENNLRSFRLRHSFRQITLNNLACHSIHAVLRTTVKRRRRNIPRRYVHCTRRAGDTMLSFSARRISSPPIPVDHRGMCAQLDETRTVKKEEKYVSMRTLSLSRFSSHGFVCPTTRNRVKWDWSATDPSKNVTKDNGKRIIREDILWTNILTKPVIGSSTRHLLNEPRTLGWKQKCIVTVIRPFIWHLFYCSTSVLLLPTRMICAVENTRGEQPYVRSARKQPKSVLKALFSQTNEDLTFRILVSNPTHGGK